MDRIEIKIAAFGALEKQIPQNISLNFSSEIYISDVIEQVIKRFPESAKLIDRCACALGEDIVPRQTLLTSNTTVVLLSPVAGG